LFDLKTYLSSRSSLIDSFLREYFSFDVKPGVFREAMAYSLFAGGKRIRPVLALASYEACGGHAEDIVRYASALELIHTYSLVHDDLPAMDDDDLRRGRPTNHKVYGEAMAILAGDGLLTEAFHMLSAPQGGVSERALLAVIRDVSEKAGLWGMVAGQAQDILSESGLSEAAAYADVPALIEFIHLHKTAQLINASVRLGAVLAEAPPEKLNALGRYGLSVGLAFQVVDDILDVKGDTALMGKTAGSDQRKGKLTYPAVYGIERSSQEAERLVGKALDALAGFGSEAEPLRAIARYILERKH
jgi:geranylgeranyl diphosphate synthase type II